MKIINVCYLKTDNRRKNLKDGVLFINNNDYLGHGEDVLIEMYLLSNCEHLICTSSGVSLIALYINPMLSFDKIYQQKDA